MGAGEAESGVQLGGGEPYVVKYLVRTALEYYRVWSDGQIDLWQRSQGQNECDFAFNRIVVEPVVHPCPVVAADADSSVYILEFADGRVDHIGSGLRCTVVGEGGDPFCFGDIDRNGTTNFDDLLFVLRDWGACGE